MAGPIWFDDIETLGRMAPGRAAVKLREIGEIDAAAALEVAGTETHRPTTFGEHGGWWPFQDKPWQYNAHAFGYLGFAQPGSDSLPIQHAGNITADATLKNGRLRITLDQLRVASYPGRGTHRILFDFYAQNQVPGATEHLHFNSTFRIREGQQAGIIGYPIFIGLNVGSEGVAFKCFTVNVANDEDEALLGMLESDVFRAGLKLATAAQPAIAPLSGMAVALTKNIAGRHRNVPVQDFYMGLDFTNRATGARLAEGSYIAVQIPDTFEREWDWNEWAYLPTSGQIINKNRVTEIIPYNYVIFGVNRYSEG